MEEIKTASSHEFLKGLEVGVFLSAKVVGQGPLNYNRYFYIKSVFSR